MMERTRQKLRRILEQAQDEVRSSVRKLDEMRNRRDIDKTRSHLNESFTQAAGKLEKALEEEAPEVSRALSRKQEKQKPSYSEGLKIEIGTTVRIPKWKSTGTVLDMSGEKIKVAMGTLQMTLSTQDVEPIASPSLKPPTVKTKVTAEAGTPPSQIDLRGIRLDDAMSQLEHYLDYAYRSGYLAEVTIVHGLGTGALREGAHKLLHQLPYIKNFRDGGAGHGGAGATIVEFERD
jgi:DNA mismatch repair protein MutS2